jgi:hypothetical protein
MRTAIFSIMFLALLSATQAAAATLELEIETVKASEKSPLQEPGITIKFKQETNAAIEEFERQRVGEETTLRIGNESLMTSTVREPIFQGTLTIGGGRLTYDVLLKMERDLKSGKRKLFLDGSDK